MMRQTYPLPAASLRCVAALILLLLCQAAAASTDAGWTLAREGSGIALFTREVPGSPYLEVKATAVIDTSIDKVTAAFGDGNRCAAWRRMCKSSQVLKVASRHERFVHMVLDLPWPMSDRDLVVRAVTEIDEASRSATVHMAPAPGVYPLQDYIRAQSHAQFNMQVLNEGQVALSYRVHIDLGGDASPGLVNPRLASSTFEDMARLVAMARG